VTNSPKPVSSGNKYHYLILVQARNLGVAQVDGGSGSETVLSGSQNVTGHCHLKPLPRGFIRQLLAGVRGMGLSSWHMAFSTGLLECPGDKTE
jgi:hypothetical protein